MRTSATRRRHVASGREPTARRSCPRSVRSRQIDAGVLNVGYAEAGPADGPAVILLHGWPYDIHSYVDVAPLLAAAGYRVIVPYLRGYGTTRFLSDDDAAQRPAGGAGRRRHRPDGRARDRDGDRRAASTGARGRPTSSRRSGRSAARRMVSVSGYLIGSQEAGKAPLPPQAELQWWYQYYFATERGRAGYDKYRHDFAKLIWQTASPKWNFDDATFDRSAAAFDNPDHVDIVIHNYRWRLGLARRRAAVRRAEQRLAAGPVITVPDHHARGRRQRRAASGPRAYAGSSRASTSTGRSRAASGTTCRRKRPERSPRRFSTSFPNRPLWSRSSHVRHDARHHAPDRRTRPWRLRRRFQSRARGSRHHRSRGFPRDHGFAPRDRRLGDHGSCSRSRSANGRCALTRGHWAAGREVVHG